MACPLGCPGLCDAMRQIIGGDRKIVGPSSKEYLPRKKKHLSIETYSTETSDKEEEDIRKAKANLYGHNRKTRAQQTWALTAKDLLAEKKVVGFWKTLMMQLNLLLKQKEEKRIRDFIKTHYNMIIKDQKKILASFPDRPYRKIKLNKVIVRDNDDEPCLINNSVEVLEAVHAHFSGQYKERRHKAESIPER
ncbi:hypothetical protein C2G38_2178249 [Gigaspora rosea]|uniref:Uncharacterized protein n=1 Tax=Gigaspora rosea TaxID=44941 RepID=A0A397VEG1_9GLOM|nr:hypothetical protein C2G38_2178249 [Gigaspora rosea]